MAGKQKKADKREKYKDPGYAIALRAAKTIKRTVQSSPVRRSAR